MSSHFGRILGGRVIDLKRRRMWHTIPGVEIPGLIVRDSFRPDPATPLLSAADTAKLNSLRQRQKEQQQRQQQHGSTDDTNTRASTMADKEPKLNRMQSGHTRRQSINWKDKYSRKFKNKFKEQEIGQVSYNGKCRLIPTFSVSNDHQSQWWNKFNLDPPLLLWHIQ